MIHSKAYTSNVYSIHPIISTLLQNLKSTKYWFSSFQWVPLQDDMNEICATFRPPITIFLMAGALTTYKHSIGSNKWGYD